MVAECECAELARELIEISCHRQSIVPLQPTFHSDRGPAMKAKSVALLLSDLGVKKQHKRPHVSNDNPFSEAQFKTVKYHPTFPDRFGSLQDVRAWAQDFFDWYNNHHRHSSLGLMTPLYGPLWPGRTHSRTTKTGARSRLQRTSGAFCERDILP